MTSRYGLILALTLGVRAAVPTLAQADVLLPPYDGSAPPAKIATDDQALATLHQHGIARVSGLGRVGDYWEGEGLLKGKPVIAYVFNDGALKVEPIRPGDRIPVQAAELPD
jgi:hypothetical protein